MRTGFWLGAVAMAGLAVGVQAQAPQGSTGLCKDGTYTQASMRKDACKAHGGVKTWYPADGGASSAPAGGTLNPTPAPEAGGQASMDGMTQKAPKRPARQTPAAPVDGYAKVRPQAPGAAPGMVWVDAKTNKYYCAADPNYGRTAKGKYASESDANSSGAKIAKGQNCAIQ